MSNLIQGKLGKMYHYYPVSVAIATCSYEGKNNMIALAWHTALSFDPPLYGISISPKRFSYNLIEKSRCFALNFIPNDYNEVVAIAGGASGSFCDKFEKYNIPFENAKSINTVILPFSLAVYECELVKKVPAGDHSLFIGQIKNVLIDPRAFKDDEILNLNFKIPSLYMGNDNYLILEKFELKKFSRKKYQEK